MINMSDLESPLPQTSATELGKIVLAALAIYDTTPTLAMKHTSFPPAPQPMSPPLSTPKATPTSTLPVTAPTTCSNNTAIQTPCPVTTVIVKNAKERIPQHDTREELHVTGLKYSSCVLDRTVGASPEQLGSNTQMQN